MSVARGSQNGGHYYSNVVTPQEIQIQWVVNAADSGGLGITGLQSNGWVRYVFMHTSATAGVVDGVTNPNPATGRGFLQLKQNFQNFLGSSYSLTSPGTAGSTITTTVQHTTYQINALGTTTLAQWQAVGLPTGIVPAVGVVFVATVAQAIGGSGTVKTPTESATLTMETMGNTDLNQPSSIAAYGGQYFHFQFLSATTTILNPVDTTIVNLRLYFDRSSVTVDGL